MKPTALTIEYQQILDARTRLAPHLSPTLLEIAAGYNTTWFKLENTNRTHSFKVRGALNAMLSMDDAARKRGIITASSGNHAQGVAYAAQVCGVTARILMPPHTPRRKIAGVQRYGAEALLYGATYDDAEKEARRLEREQGYTFLSPYNDPDVIAGAGTVGLEILDALPQVERVIVAVSGGGLISGVATAMKTISRRVEVIGVCAEVSPAMYNLYYDEQRPAQLKTLAEALSGDVEAGSITISMVRQLVDEIVLVSEDQIANAMRWLLDEQGWMVEGGGAAAWAALLSGVVKADSRKTVVIVSGGNVDGDALREVLCR